MNAFDDPLVETVVCMFCSQSGKTEALLNMVGRHIDIDPCPILMIQPTLEISEAWSKDRLNPMLRDTRCLHGKVKDSKLKDSDNTIKHKAFKGGHLTVAGANSPASLAGRPIRIVLCDEIDRYPISAGIEGDPVDLARKRATNFWNRKIGLTSTPTQKGISRIEMAYEQSDKRKYYVPCPSCGRYQWLKFSQLKWPQDHPEQARYECELCPYLWTDYENIKAVKLGEWRAEAEFNGTAGFWLNGLYSPWLTFSDITKEFYKAKGNKETLKVFTNTILAETWEESGEEIDEGMLLKRVEKYGKTIPAGAAVLTCAVDVQDNRLEAEVVAWGDKEESWSMDYRVFYGSPALSDVWNELDAYINESWEHESGIKMKVACTTIDTGGHYTKQAYSFVKTREGRRVYAIKGSSQPGQPIVCKPSKRNIANVMLFSIGTDTAKDQIFANMKIEDHGPGYMHFPDRYTKEYFDQLTAEVVRTRYIKGRPHRVYEIKQSGLRNEALDLKVYNLAALSILNPNMEYLLGQLIEQSKEIKQEVVEKVKNEEYEHTVRSEKKWGNRSRNWMGGI
jgi:phage terminase large subunit GpA-like protein